MMRMLSRLRLAQPLSVGLPSSTPRQAARQLDRTCLRGQQMCGVPPHVHCQHPCSPAAAMRHQLGLRLSRRCASSSETPKHILLWHSRPCRCSGSTTVGCLFGDPFSLCRAGWGSSTHQGPGGQPHCRRGPRLRSRWKAFRVSARRRSSRGAASPSASPTALRTHHLQEVHTWPPRGPSLCS